MLAASGCESTASFTVAADDAMAPVLSRVVDEASPEDLGCVEFTVVATPAAEVSTAVSSGTDPPDLWAPASSVSVGAVTHSTGRLVDLAARSLAASPVVVAARAGEAPFYDRWISVLQSPLVRLGDPLHDPVATGPVLGALAEDPTAAAVVDAALDPIARAQSGTTVPDVEARLAAVEADGGVAVASEQDVVAHRGAPLSATTPVSGSYVLDHPLAVTAPVGPRHDEAKTAGVALAAAVDTVAGRTALSEAGLRTPDLTPLSNGRGVGEVAALAPADRGVVVATLGRYAQLATTSRVLILQDLSASMGSAAGGNTRAGLAAEGLAAGVRAFPDGSSAGLWIAPGAVEVVPVQRLGGDGRAQLLGAATTLPSRVGGDGGLYDSVLAAFRAMQQSYDPTAENTVVVVTDGTTEPPADLLDTLRAEQDPSAPVSIVTIGLTDDADAAVLQQISAVTGGSTAVARNPAEIPNAFTGAMKARALR